MEDTEKVHLSTCFSITNDVPSVVPGIKKMVDSEAQKITSSKSLLSGWEQKTVNKSRQNVGKQKQDKERLERWLCS